MPRAVLLAVLAAATVTVATDALGSDRGSVTPAGLALIPLSKADLGAEAVALPLDPDSGVQTNKEAADDAVGNVTAAQLARLGRITGYGLDYNDAGGAALTNGHGLLSAETSVALYRSGPAAADAIDFWRNDELLALKIPLKGITFSLKSVPPTGFSSDAFAFTAKVTFKGKPPVYSAEVVFRVDELVAQVAVSAAGDGEARSLAVALAQKLASRIALAQAGKLKGPPVPLPGKVKAGPPPNGPDLSKLALTIGDLGSGKLVHQGYKLDTDFSPISDYEREFAPAGAFLDVQEEVELFHSPTEAGYIIGIAVSIFRSKQALEFLGGADLKKAHIASYTPMTVGAFKAGDESHAVIATLKLDDGRTLSAGYAMVRIGSTVELLIVTSGFGTRLSPSALVELTKQAAIRASIGLGAA